MWENPLVQLLLLLLAIAAAVWATNHRKARQARATPRGAAAPRERQLAPRPAQRRQPQEDTPLLHSLLQQPAAPAPAAPARPPVVEQPDPAQATAAAVAALLPRVPYEHRATLDQIPFIVDSRRWHALSVRNAQEWGWGVFGSSRSGKGNFLQLVALACLGLGPEACEVWVLDPKTGLDYGFALGVRHARLYADGIRADGVLTAGYEAVLAEMQRRNAILQQAGARNIQEYHSQGHPPMPYLVVIADEVAQLDAAQRNLLNKIASMSAASGIVLFVATQYPTSEYLSSQVQINLQNRLVFRLASPRYTEVALGLGKGAKSTYEPSAIQSPGVAVLRRGGQADLVGRVPEITDELRQGLIDSLKLQWPREEPAEVEPQLVTPAPPPAEVVEQPATEPAAPSWTEQHIKVALAIGLNPGVSTRALARMLYPGTDGSGDYSGKAKAVRLQVEQMLREVREAVKPGVSEPDNSPPAEELHASQASQSDQQPTETPDTALAA